jgi:hypothetical protein
MKTLNLVPLATNSTTASILCARWKEDNSSLARAASISVTRWIGTSFLLCIPTCDLLALLFGTQQLVVARTALIVVRSVLDHGRQTLRDESFGDIPASYK